MFLTRISVSHPVFATMVMVALLVFGFYSYQRLPIEQMPDIDFPVVAVVVSYPGASPEAVESDIIEPIEDTINTIAGLDTVQSTAQSSSALVLMIFDLEVSSEVAVQDVRDKISQVQAELPDNAGTPLILRFDPSELPILSLAVTSDTLSARDLTTLTEDVIATRLSNISGVGSASAVGGIERQLNVLVDPDRLAAFNVGVSDVMNAIAQENQNLPAGTITQGTQVQTIQVEGRIENEDDFLDLIVSRQGGQPVYLRDVADIEDGQGDEQSLALLNGERALAVDIIKTQGANTVQVAHDIHEAIAEMMDGELPEGVRIEVVRDNAVPVEQSFHAVQNMIVEGAALAVVIVFLFLNSWRSTVITGMTLPISIIGTMIFLNFFGFTLNMMTLMALSLAVGILIDDAIVVRENIMRHLHMGKNHRQAALDGTNEIGLAVLATTLSIVAVFLPVAFMDGIMGRFFLQFGVTVSVAVLISLFVAFTLDPMMSSVWYDPTAHPGAKRGPVGKAIQQFDRFFEWVTGGYRAVLRWCLKWRKTTLMLALASFIGTFFLLPFVGAEFIPVTDNSEVTVTLETPTGSSLDYTASKIRQVHDTLTDLPEVVSTYATVASGTSQNGNNTATIVVSMVPEAERTISPTEFAVTVRQRLSVIPGAKVTVSAAAALGGPSAPISVSISGPSFDELDRISQRLMAQMREIDGIIDVESTLDDPAPIMAVRIDRDLASDLGVSLAQIGGALNPMLAGDEVTDWTSQTGETVGVFVRLPEWARNDINALGGLPIVQSGANGSNGVIRLDQVATIEQSTGPSTINREELERRVNVTANIEGVNLGDVTPQIQAIVDAMSVPTGYSVSQGGEAEDLAETGTAAGSALLLAIVFIYLVLASQFGSFLQPFAIMAALPLSLIGVVLGLLVGGSTLNMMSMIGFIMLMGLVVKNAILLVDNANQHVRQGWNLFDALVEAGSTRFRPIIMTTLAMIFGMLPLALSLHEGSGQNAPMAHAVIGGLLSSTALTLVVVPVMLTYIDGFGRFVGRFLPKAPVDDHVPVAQIEHHAPAE